MVEPQESSIRKNMLSKQQKSATKLMSEGKRLPEEMIAAAEQKFAGFRSLKSEIDGEMDRVHEVLDGVRKKITENIQSDINKEGLLGGNHDDYLKCLETNYRDLELLLRKDEAKWT